LALIFLSPLFLVLAIWIKADSKGPVFFKQKRIGKDRAFFQIYKFRTMRSDTPKDTPTHLLNDPASFITKSGSFLRKTSLDELPQLINILKGEMAVIGPRPALWNQDDLADERDKYGANDVLPGLTGWAQINGRDELPIEVKAKLDGEYIENMGFWFDLRCFFGTFLSILKGDGVVEGGTGTLEKNKNTTKQMENFLMKKILITGKNSYIGRKFKEWVEQWPDEYIVEGISVRGDEWKEADFSSYDSILHVAGIDHNSSNPKLEDKYYQVK